MPEVVEGGLDLLEMLEVLEALEVMCRVLVCMLEAEEGEICLLDVLLEVLEVMRCVLLCTLEAVESRLCLPEVPEVMRCATLYT